MRKTKKNRNEGQARLSTKKVEGNEEKEKKRKEMKDNFCKM